MSARPPGVADTGEQAGGGERLGDQAVRFGATVADAQQWIKVAGDVEHRQVRLKAVKDLRGRTWPTRR
jgi:hypothetical protein